MKTVHFNFHTSIIITEINFNHLYFLWKFLSNTPTQYFHDESRLSYIDYELKLIAPLNTPDYNCVKTVHFNFQTAIIIMEININQL